MDFDEQLKKAVARGRQRGERKTEQQAAEKMTEDEFRRMHSSLRLSLSDYIEECLKKIPQHFPGFSSETVYGERGWGAACSRDDLRLERGKRTNLYSRIELTIRPYSSLHVIELAGKATVCNREVFHRQFFQELPDVDESEFRRLIDAWVLEFAELYAAKT